MSSTPIKYFTIKPVIRLIQTLVTGTALIAFAGSAPADTQSMDKTTMMSMQKTMKSDMALMKPDLQKQVKGLSKQTKMELMKILSKHERRSKQLTLRQVMNEVLSDYQSIISGLATDNTEQAADSARRLANHRLPVGGLLPYMKQNDVNDESLASLVGFNDLVEGNALRLASAADKGNISEATGYVGKIAEGCVACHQVFRGQPGLSSRLR
ncbi:MAG: hypothetical protein OQK76_13555 [Gammaproteobacteria bacterium]|nr:hypothetical protein [Gammaproteobacteria bacterium]MCW8911634.1 hypothetical protein [Gammaproteobacteria bacterium]MCW9055790.1 hypothetical protein [Gammaproteobacteria bacterium]